MANTLKEANKELQASLPERIAATKARMSELAFEIDQTRNRENSNVAEVVNGRRIRELDRLKILLADMERQVEK